MRGLFDQFGNGYVGERSGESQRLAGTCGVCVLIIVLARCI
jgi:hypothetical protein